EEVVVKPAPLRRGVVGYAEYFFQHPCRRLTDATSPGSTLNGDARRWSTGRPSGPFQKGNVRRPVRDKTALPGTLFCCQPARGTRDYRGPCETVERRRRASCLGAQIA